MGDVHVASALGDPTALILVDNKAEPLRVLLEMIVKCEDACR